MKLFMLSVGYVVATVECCRFGSRGKGVSMAEGWGIEVICWFNRFDRKQPSSIVLLCLPSLRTSPLGLKPVVYISQRSRSLVLCSDACDPWLVLVLLLMKDKGTGVVLHKTDCILRHMFGSR